jgi:hypothetical protein
MLLATILLCGNLAMPDCLPEQNLGVQYVPGKFASPFACLAAGQQVAAQHALERIKIICGPTHLRIGREA